MAQINYFEMGKELSPEMRSTANAAFNTIFTTHTLTTEVLKALKKEPYCMERTATEIADIMQGVSEMWQTTAEDFRSFAINCNNEGDKCASRAVAELRTAVVEAEGILLRFERVCALLNLNKEESEELMSPITSLVNALGKYMGKAMQEKGFRAVDNLRELQEECTPVNLNDNAQ